jgi:signal transduction histidine kinase
MRKPVNQLQRLNVILLTMVIVSSAIMILMNYYTIKILSASRAYINGESQYSKGQQEASGHLITYIYSQNPADYTLFENEIRIPIGDRIAREALSIDQNHSLAKKGFLQANNDLDDIDDMIWLFDSFKHVGLFEKSITIWYQGDVMIEKLRQIGLLAHHNIALKQFNTLDRDNLLVAVNDVSTQLTIKERAFSNTLGTICREVNFYIFLANIIIILIIITSVVLYTGRMIHNIEDSREKIAEQNEHLIAVNKELDQLIYSVTHDLRSPLTSLSGLIGLIDRQTEIEQIKPYVAMMKTSIDKQNKFIKTILASSKKQKRTKELCNMVLIVDDVIAQNHTIINGKEIQFIKELKVTDIFCDELKLQTILNNLISNAIKYSDVNKLQPFVKIRSFKTEDWFVMEVEDNGIGINAKNRTRIFDKHFMVEKNDQSNGLGLFLIKEMVEQMNGEIEAKSKPGQGSTFILKLPLYH